MITGAVAAMLFKHVHHRQDAFGEPAALHYIRTKDDVEQVAGQPFGLMFQSIKEGR
jgi:hypothetical protein